MAGDWINWQQFQQANEPAVNAQKDAEAQRDSGQIAGANAGLDQAYSGAMGRGQSNLNGYAQYQQAQIGLDAHNREMQHRALTAPGWSTPQPQQYAQQWGDLSKRMAGINGDLQRNQQLQKPRAAVAPEGPAKYAQPDKWSNTTRGSRYTQYSDAIGAGRTYQDASQYLKEDEK